MRNVHAAMVVLCFVVVAPALAQFPEDALRLGLPGIGVGARALGMGDAYTGVANDYSAIYWNPAGLTQALRGEFNVGLSYMNQLDKGSFFDNKTNYTSNATNLNTLGFVYPVPVRRGSMVFAFGFNRQSNFTSGLSFSGFNPISSYIQTSAPDGALYPSDISSNLAYQLYLANIDTVAGRFISPIKNRVTQSGTVIEDNGLNNWSVGGAVDFAKDFSLGVTLTYVAGSYRYDRNYQEQDLDHLYQSQPFDFSQMTLKEYIESDISGFSAKFGLMYRVPEQFRIGFTVKTPTWYYVRENFGTEGRSFFDNGDVMPAGDPFKTQGSGEYDVHTPWVFSTGLSVILKELVVSGDVDFTDWTSLRFANANSDVLDWNFHMGDIFRATFNYRGGLEYAFQPIGLRLRGGYVHNRSPYKGDPSSFDQQYVTGGLGIPVGGSTMIDLAYAHGWWKTFRYNYDSTSRVDESIATNNFLMTLVYRF
jgi:long-subunit fatty acid transport protein